MAHGYPDWFGTLPKENVFGTQDVIELAQRMGLWYSPSRRGNLFWCDFCVNFDYIWKWGFSSQNYSIQKSIITLPFGQEHFAIVGTNVRYIAVNMFASVLRPPACKAAVELLFIPIGYVYYFEVGFYDGDICTGVKFGAQLDQETNYILLHKGWGYYERFQHNLDITLRSEYINYLRLGFDLANNTYTYLTINSNTFIPPNVKVTPGYGTGYREARFYIEWMSYLDNYTLIPLLAAVYINDE
jgi:hypothetical protein